MTNGQVTAEYKTLRSWLVERNGRQLTNALSTNGDTYELWNVLANTFIVHRYSERDEWEIYSPVAPENSIIKTLEAVEAIVKRAAA